MGSENTTVESKQCANFTPFGDEDCALWKSIRYHPFIGASIIDCNGRLHWANARATLLYLGDATIDLAGKSIFDIFHKDWCDERIELMAELNKTGRNAVLRHVRRGQSIVTTYNPLPTPEGEPQLYLILIGEAEDDEKMAITDDYDIFDTGLINLGPLDALSRRELEVLAMISQGLTTDQIAKDLSRSPKTIEAHRSSIARKLGVKNRVQLAEIAHKASLEIRHANLKRIPSTP